MDPVSFMEREISQLVKTDVAYKDRLFIGNVHLVCPHHKCLDLMGSWEAPNKSTLQGMGPVHASKASRRGLRLDHLFNEREGSHGARGASSATCRPTGARSKRWTSLRPSC